jgi:hypothetical protein
MIKIPGITAIICGSVLALCALWAAIPSFSEPEWYSNGWFWILAALTGAACVLIVWVGVTSIRTPKKQNIEASGWISAIIVISAARVAAIEQIDHSIGRIVTSIASAVVIALLFYLLIKTARERCA